VKSLRARFGLVLSIVLLVAILLPVPVLYLLSKSGLVEATYITDTRDLGEQETSWRSILVDELLPVSGVPRSPLIEEIRDNLPLWWMIVSSKAGQQRIPLVFDPQTGQITGIAADSLDRIMLSSQIFKFRADLPAWIVIGSFPLFGLLMGFVLSLVMSRSVTRPVSQLADAARAIGRRELGYRVETRGSQELVDLAQSFNRMADELEQAETTRRNLMADVAHELRTPLTVLDGSLRAMLDGVRPLNEEEIALLAEQTHHLSRLVEDLRELSLAESDRLSLDLQPIDLSRLVCETVAHFEPIALDQNILLTVEPGDELIHPSLDDHRVRQSLHNLLANALRHTPAGGTVQVITGKMAGENVFEITVTDSGAGISPDDLPHIFDRFYRAEHSPGNGTGLGLAIVKALIEAQGGQVRVSSPGAGLGSTFRLSLPVA
jgi:signal transduction histidine kinase